MALSINIIKTTVALQFRRLFHGNRAALAGTVTANIAIIGLNVMIGLLVARHYSLDEYGQLAYFSNVFGTLRLIAALGMTGQVNFDLARARGAGKVIADHFYPLLVIRSATLCVMTLFVVVIGYARSDLMLTIAGVAATIALMNDFATGTLQGMGDVRRVIMLMALQPLLYAFGAAIAVGRGLPVQIVYAIFSASFIPPILVAAVWVRRLVGLPGLRWAPTRDVWLSLRFAGGLYILAIAGTFYTSFATLYLGMASRFTDAALITVPLNLIFMMSLLSNMTMTTFFFPRINLLYTQNNLDDAQALFKLFYGLVSAATLLLSVTLMLYPHTVLGLLYGARYQESAPLLILLAPVACIYTLQNIVTYTIVMQGRLRASLPGAIIPVVVLMGVMVASSGLSDSLIWFAVAHTLSAVLGLVWQLRIVHFAISSLLFQSTRQLLVALALVGSLRLVILDTQNNLLAIFALGIGGIGYLAWIWHETRGIR